MACLPQPLQSYIPLPEQQEQLVASGTPLATPILRLLRYKGEGGTYTLHHTFGSTLGSSCTPRVGVRDAAGALLSQVLRMGSSLQQGGSSPEVHWSPEALHGRTKV